MVETVTLNPALDRTLWVEKMRLDGSLDGRIVHQVFAAPAVASDAGVVVVPAVSGIRRGLLSSCRISPSSKKGKEPGALGST